MASNQSKTMSKVFINDLNVQRFSGIFSAHYCWPENCGQKSWSQVMCDSPEWFSAKLWPKVVDKLPLITGQQQSIQQINELMFGLILKELDLLSFSQMQYFEVVLDLFNDEITIGLICWLKICHQFNWRLIYAKQVVKHKNKLIKQLIQLIVDAVDENQNFFTSEEISYFYSLVECICVQLLANNIVSNTSADSKISQFCSDIRSKSWSKLSQMSFDPFVRQLYTFNVLNQELIGFSMELIQSDCLCYDIIEGKLEQIEGLFTDCFEELNINPKIPIDISDRLSEDISVAKDNQKSLQLVNNQYFLTNESKLVVESMENFFKMVANKTKHLLPLNQFHYLSDILSDKQSPNFQQLVEIVLCFANFETFESIMSYINGADIANCDLAINVAKRLVKTSIDPKTKTFLTAILVKSLKLSKTIDLKSRLKELKINKICEPKTDSIKTLFNQITKDDMNSSLFEDLSHELLIGIYLSPFQVYNFVLDMALHHNRAQIGLVAKLICEQLHCLTTFVFNSEEKETFILKFVVHLLMERPTIQLVEDMTRLIEHIVNYPMPDDLEPVFTFDNLFLYLIKYNSNMKSDAVWIKLRLIKNLIELSGDQSWDTVLSQPVPTLMFLLQFLEYFWLNPNRKQLVIDILNQILDKKMTRNLTEKELTDLDGLLANCFRYTPGKASSRKIYLAYCAKRFPKPVAEVIEVTKNVYHDQILCYATITPDFLWICNIYPEYQLFSEQTKTALVYILPTLTTQEFNRLYKFLQMYYYNSSVVHQLRTAIFAIDNSIDKKPYIKCLMDIVTNEVLIPMRSEILERPLTEEDFDFIRMDLGILFKTMATFDYQMLPNDMTIHLKQILTELAEMMFNEGIIAYNLYNDDNKIPVTAREALKQVYGYGFPNVNHEDSEELTIKLMPAGISRVSARNHSIEQTVCQ